MATRAIRGLSGARTYASHVQLPLNLPSTPPDAPQPPQQSQTKENGSVSAGSVTKDSTSSKDQPSSHSLLPKARLDYNLLLRNPKLTTQNHLLRKSNLPLGADHINHIHRLRDTQLLLLSKLTSIRSKQKELRDLLKHGLADDREEIVRQSQKLKKRINEYEQTLSDTETELLELSLQLPNFTHPAVPLGPEAHALEIDRFGPPLVEPSKTRDHLDIANHFNWIDNHASVLASGSSWPYLRSTLALLEHALINYGLSIAIKRGFTPVSPPDVIKSDLAWRCGFQPRDAGGLTQTYSLDQDGLCLAGTAEIPLSAMFATRTFSHTELPLKVVGVGNAFRAEAGARGSDTRGLYRVHQFRKVELFAVTSSQSNEMMEEIGSVQKEIAEGLGLSVRVLEMPTEELGASASRKWDMEAWMPGRGKWGEISSLSNCTDYQSRRLHIRYHRDPSGSDAEAIPFAHTLNGTAAAIPRLIVALVENGARFGSDGTVRGIDLPKALERFWLGGNDIPGKQGGSIRWI